MKPPVVHQPIQPPPAPQYDQPEDLQGSVERIDEIAGENGRVESAEGRKPGLVGDFGPLVGTLTDSRDGAADDERETF